jgi:hypothetical protein
MITEARLFWTKHPPMCPREHDALPEEAKRERRLDQRAADAAYTNRLRGTPIPPELAERARQFTARPETPAEATTATPPAQAAVPDAAGFWSTILNNLFEPRGPHARQDRQEAPPARGIEIPPKPAAASSGDPSAFWKPIMAKIAAERAAAAPAPQAPAAQRQEREGQGAGESLDWGTIVRKVADPARTVEHGPGRPRPGSDAAAAVPAGAA